MFERINAEHLLEYLYISEEVADAASAKRRMEAYDFDVLGVSDKHGRVYGYIRRDCPPSGSCSDHAIPFHAFDLISESTPIEEVLGHLRTKPRVFVLGGGEVYGIITRGDLQKPPVRIFVFGLITILDMQLTATVRTYFPQDSWCQLLAVRRVNAARKLLEQRVARNEEIDLTDCLQFCDKRDLVLREESARKNLGFQSKASGRQFLIAVEDLRNRVAHGQDLVTGTTWEELIQLIERVDLQLAKMPGRLTSRGA
ncbi:MAG TPA: CBS domain-containing protein [Longimicrobiales bacterium]